MIEYIIISYVLMALWCIKHWFCEDESLKTCFKSWLVSPVSFPWYLAVKFVGW